VSALCRALGVSRSGFHGWQGRAPSAREQADCRLATVIRAAHTEHRQAYGTRRLWRVLVGRGEVCGRHRVARLRRRHGVVTLRRKRFVRARAAYQRVPAAPNRLAWPFASSAPDRVWVGDITHVATREGWLFLATVLDVCSRRIVGWAMEAQQTLDLAERALHMALVQRRPEPGLILHHDQGCQYTSARYRAKAEAAKLLLSMSRPGMPYDNAMAESFFSTLKLELAPDQAFATREAARLALFEYIEVFYNRLRMHSRLGYQSPAQFEERFNRLRYVS
jgi:putative transposase